MHFILLSIKSNMSSLLGAHILCLNSLDIFSGTPTISTDALEPVTPTTMESQLMQMQWTVAGAFLLMVGVKGLMNCACQQMMD